MKSLQSFFIETHEMYHTFLTQRYKFTFEDNKEVKKIDLSIFTFLYFTYICVNWKWSMINVTAKIFSTYICNYNIMRHKLGIFSTFWNASNYTKAIF